MQADWEDQRSFLAVLESGSLSAAARQLGVAQPTVRSRIERLERSLGAVLFTRSANGLAPTAQARALGQHARAMAMASDAFVRAASASVDAIAGTVRLSVSEFVGVEVLPPMLAPLRARHPDLSIEISLSNAPADLLGQEVDIAVRMHPPRQEALVARRIGAIPLCLFAHRDYVTRHGRPESLEALSDFDLIGPDRSIADLSLLGRLGPAMERAAFAIRTDSHPAQFAAIRAGLGIGVVQRPLGLRTADLVPILPAFVAHEMESWIVMHEDLRRVPRIRALFNHLVAEFTRYARQE